MQQLISIWMALDGRRRAIVVTSMLAMFGGILLLSRIAATPTYALLYSGLEPGTAGEIVQSLEQRSVAYDIRGNSIYVDTSRRDELRMSLASEGLPALNGQGYELLDALSGFGTTAQMFDAAYWRAKEGELARTIIAGAQIRTARVHIANSSSQPFRKNVTSSASVTATSVSGSLTSANAKALKFLVASAVAGLSPEGVSIIDGRSGVVVFGDSLDGSIGEDRAVEMKKNVERLLEARVGQGNVVVEVNIETVTESEAITETHFDPDNRVAISSEVEERTTNTNGSRSGGVTVASNLPSGEVGDSGNKSSSLNSETRQRTNFEVSETRREILRTPGAIKRISTAVLVDGEYLNDEQSGSLIWQARSEEELQALEDLVAAAVGLNLERGDTLTLKSMEFEIATLQGTVGETSFVQRWNLDVMRLIQIAILSAVMLVLGLFVLRPIFFRTAVPALAGPTAASYDAERRPGRENRSLEQAVAPAVAVEAITGEIDDSDGIPAGLSIVGGGKALDPPVSGPLASQTNPVDKLRQMIENRQDETVEILRNWIEDEEEHA